MQQQISEHFSLEQAQAGIERLNLQLQTIIDAANKLLKKQEMERGQLTQQLSHFDAEFKHDNFASQNTQMISSTSKSIPLQQVSVSEFSFPTQFIFPVKTQRQTKSLASLTKAISFTEHLIQNSTNFLPAEKHCNDSYLIRPIREPYDSFYPIFIMKLVNKVLLMYLSQ